MSDLRIADVLARAVREAPDRAAVVFPDESVTYRELADRVESMARGLIATGVRPGSSVATFMPNSVDHLVAIFAATGLGALCVPLNTRFRRRELSYVLRDCGATVVLTTLLGAEFSDLPARLGEVVGEGDARAAAFPDLGHVVMVGPGTRPGIVDAERFAELADTVPAERARELAAGVTPDDRAIMIYTSGTTASPKGVPLRGRQLTGIGCQIAGRLGARSGDRLWDALPMFHSSALLPLLATFSVAGTFVSSATPEPGVSMELIRRERATLLWPAFTHIWQAILADPGFAPEHFRVVRAVLCIGPGDTLRHLEAKLPNAPLLSCYGITEGSGIPVMVAVTDDAHVRLDTGGLPFDGVEAKVVDTSTGEPAAPGVVGELALRGANVFDGYWNDPEGTAKVLDADGWFSTGDLAVGDGEGRVSYQGRLKDMLKVGGENVAALEIEALISTHPAVKTVAVVGAPDDRLMEVPAAFVELKPGASASAEELRTFCVGQLASFKVPRYVRLVTEWPMSATKIRKIDLVRQLALETGGDQA
ncbi:class I adenylate-forming enzyme family protein [Pseudonocardia ailaonensis]|uniref:Class I adenylate-forming enzyme family protein n=1 Tax=Pseudonocardia ailaonensis TaxID=367279 RepID=A0ABN2N4Z3_9PSEU